VCVLSAKVCLCCALPLWDKGETLVILGANMCYFKTGRNLVILGKETRYFSKSLIILGEEKHFFGGKKSLFWVRNLII
jgi:hypothetical protein